MQQAEPDGATVEAFHVRGLAERGEARSRRACKPAEKLLLSRVWPMMRAACPTTAAHLLAVTAG
jgi:hypothetical protein